MRCIELKQTWIHSENNYLPVFDVEQHLIHLCVLLQQF